MAIPPTTQVNELLQRFLLIGNTKFQRMPMTISPAPQASKQYTLCISLNPSLFNFIHSPVSMPKEAVPMAGMMPNIPSGSWIPLYSLPYKKRRSIYPTKHPSIVKGSPFPSGAGQKANSNQYPTSKSATIPTRCFCFRVDENQCGKHPSQTNASQYTGVTLVFKIQVQQAIVDTS